MPPTVLGAVDRRREQDFCPCRNGYPARNEEITVLRRGSISVVKSRSHSLTSWSPIFPFKSGISYRSTCTCFIWPSVYGRWGSWVWVPKI